MSSKSATVISPSKVEIVLSTEDTAAPNASSAVAAAPAPAFHKRMTKADIVKSCVDNGFYRTPSCNDKLFMHYKGYDAIGGLEEFTEALVMWLEGNAISKIEGLEPCTKLKQLFLQENCIETIENLDALVGLDMLNLSDNFISNVSGLDHLSALTTLRLKNNKIKDLEEVKGIVYKKEGSTSPSAAAGALTTFVTAPSPDFVVPEPAPASELPCPALTCLDLSGNQITDGLGLMRLLQRLPDLRSLYLSGNPCVRSTTNYRKTFVAGLKHLRYLDDRPVFDDERRLAEAWAVGGAQAEKEVRAALKNEEEKAIQQRLDDFRRWTGRATMAEPGAAGAVEEPGVSKSENPANKPQVADEESSDTDENPTSSDDDEDDDARRAELWMPSKRPDGAAPQ